MFVSTESCDFNLFNRLTGRTVFKFANLAIQLDSLTYFSKTIF